MTSDSVLFVDANIYLQLYNAIDNTEKVKDTLASLKQFKEYIFITKQIVNEIQRNKVKSIVLPKIDKDRKALLSTDEDIKIPDSLRVIKKAELSEWKRSAEELKKERNKIKDKQEEIHKKILLEVSKSEDKISKGLQPLFDIAVSAKAEELSKAKERKTIGNPPGKQSDTLGDQINFEQLLSYCMNKKKIWIISADNDYGSSYEGALYLDPLLNDELKGVGIEEIYCFKDLIKGLTDFNKKTGRKAVKIPHGKEAKEVNEILNRQFTNTSGVYGFGGNFTPSSGTMFSSISNAPGVVVGGLTYPNTSTAIVTPGGSSANNLTGVTQLSPNSWYIVPNGLDMNNNIFTSSAAPTGGDGKK